MCGGKYPLYGHASDCYDAKSERMQLFVETGPMRDEGGEGKFAAAVRSYGLGAVEQAVAGYAEVYGQGCWAG